MNANLKEYKVLIDPKLYKFLNKNLPKEYREVFDEKLNYLKSNVFHPSLNTKPYPTSKRKLIALGVSEIWEFYINRRDYRCIFYVIHKETAIIIAYVGNHKQIRKKYC